MTLCVRIKEARQKANVTQAQLARQIGKAAGTVYQYEAGLRVPDYATLQKIADALGTDVNYLLHGATGFTFIKNFGSQYQRNAQCCAWIMILVIIRISIQIHQLQIIECTQ